MNKAFDIISNKTISSVMQRASCDTMSISGGQKHNSWESARWSQTCPDVNPRLMWPWADHLISKISCFSSGKWNENSHCPREMLFGLNHIKHEYCLVSSFPILCLVSNYFIVPVLTLLRKRRSRELQPSHCHGDGVLSTLLECLRTKETHLAIGMSLPNLGSTSAFS